MNLEQNGKKVNPDLLENLPGYCYARRPEDDRPILIIKDEPGHYVLSEEFDPEAENRNLNVSLMTKEIMIMCSYLGWAKTMKELKAKLRI